VIANVSFNTLDWIIIAAFFAVTLGIGIFASRRAGKNSSEYFLSGRNMPWWLLGVSMVATTFAIDTPNLVAGMVRKDGVSGNWAWWAFLPSGMLTVYVFAKLWRRAGVMTDVEFYELRYSGKEAAFLRGFRALYLGLIFNVLVMGAVCLAAVKFGSIVLGVEPWQMLLVSGLVIGIYSSIGGLRGVILTDFVQFILAMVGSIWAAIHLVNHEKIGGLTHLFSHEKVAEKMAMFPSFTDSSIWIPLMLVPLAVQWWASYFPGVEPGGGGYVAQRIFSAKNERHSIGAALFFNIAHYALRPWPWILICLASIVIFPSVESIQQAFPGTDPAIIADDTAYPAMLTLLPGGLIGLVVASLLAAFMSTMSTQVNLGASYLVNDFYKRFLKPGATEKELVRAGRIATVVTLIMGSVLGLLLKDAQQAFDYLLLLGAGTGAIYILRWYWWRINAETEIVAMVASLIVASIFTFYVRDLVHDFGKIEKELILKVLPVLITTLIWVATAFLTTPTKQATLRKFYRKVQPGGPGWREVKAAALRDGEKIDEGEGRWDVPLGLLCAFAGCLAVYGCIFTIGSVIYGKTNDALLFGIPTLLIGAFLVWSWRLIQTRSPDAQ
jgi:Na+/proline symporter